MTLKTDRPLRYLSLTRLRLLPRALLIAAALAGGGRAVAAPGGPEEAGAPEATASAAAPRADRAASPGRRRSRDVPSVAAGPGRPLSHVDGRRRPGAPPALRVARRVLQGELVPAQRRHQLDAGRPAHVRLHAQSILRGVRRHPDHQQPQRSPLRGEPHRPRGDSHARRPADRPQGRGANREQHVDRPRRRPAVPVVGVEPVVLAQLDVGLDRAADDGGYACAGGRPAAHSHQRQLLLRQLFERVQPRRYDPVVAARVEVCLRYRCVAHAPGGGYRCAAREVDGRGAASVRRVSRGDHHRRRRSDADRRRRRGWLARATVADVRPARAGLPGRDARRGRRRAVGERGHDVRAAAGAGERDLRCVVSAGRRFVPQAGGRHPGHREAVAGAAGDRRAHRGGRQGQGRQADSARDRRGRRSRARHGRHRCRRHVRDRGARSRPRQRRGAGPRFREREGDGQRDRRSDRRGRACADAEGADRRRCAARPPTPRGGRSRRR